MMQAGHRVIDRCQRTAAGFYESFNSLSFVHGKINAFGLVKAAQIEPSSRRMCVKREWAAFSSAYIHTLHLANSVTDVIVSVMDRPSLQRRYEWIAVLFACPDAFKELKRSDHRRKVYAMS